MLIATWNANAHARITLSETANQIFIEKREYIEAYCPDIAVFQEIPKPLIPNNETLFWHGEIKARGIAVTSYNQYTITPLFVSEMPRSVFPFRVEGQNSFNLFAVWSLPLARYPSLQNYVSIVVEEIKRYSKSLPAGPVVMIGDFNSNSRWDQYTKTTSHSDLVEFLHQQFNIVSAYHKCYGEKQGSESQDTFYLYRSQERNYHIDYCFVPDTWAIESVTIGQFDPWSQRSDHCPLFIKVSL